MTIDPQRLAAARAEQRLGPDELREQRQRAKYTLVVSHIGFVDTGGCAPPDSTLMRARPRRAKRKHPGYDPGRSLPWSIPAAALST